MVMSRSAERFIRTHYPMWKRLGELTDKAQSARLGALSDEELHELGVLYRRASSDLARAKTRYTSTSAGRELVRSLNALVLRAHTQVYSAPAPRAGNLFTFLQHGFPSAVHRNIHLILLAATLMFLPGIVAYFAVFFNSDAATLFVPESAIYEVQKRAEQKITGGWGARTQFEGLLSSPEASSYIMTNNIRVTILAVALGITAGIGTALVLFTNGLLIGGLAGVAANVKVNLLFWAVILPHGVLELLAISIAGGAGLAIGRALWAPGDLSRRDALKLAGAEAAQLLSGVAVMLVIAGIIEGFFTPLPLSPWLKLTFSAGTAGAILLYLWPRSARSQPDLLKSSRS